MITNTKIFLCRSLAHSFRSVGKLTIFHYNAEPYDEYQVFSFYFKQCIIYFIREKKMNCIHSLINLLFINDVHLQTNSTYNNNKKADRNGIFNCLIRLDNNLKTKSFRTSSEYLQLLGKSMILNDQIVSLQTYIHFGGQSACYLRNVISKSMFFFFIRKKSRHKKKTTKNSNYIIICIKFSN